jgi:hypothetical protein
MEEKLNLYLSLKQLPQPRNRIPSKMNTESLRHIYDEHLESIEFISRVHSYDDNAPLLIQKRTLMWDFLARQGRTLLSQDPKFAESVQRMIEDMLRAGIDKESDHEEFGISTLEHFSAKKVHDILLALASRHNSLEQLLDDTETASYEFGHVCLRIQLWKHLLLYSPPQNPKQVGRIRKLYLQARFSLKFSHFPAHAREEHALLQQLSTRF